MGLAEIGSSIGNIGSSIGSIGIEVGGIGAAVASAPAISSIGLASGLGRFGEVMTAPAFLPISEGLAPVSFLENTMPLTISNINISKGGDIFNPINTQDALFEAESILLRAAPQPIGGQVPLIFQSGLSDINLDPSIKPPISVLGILDSSPPNVILNGFDKLTVNSVKNIYPSAAPQDDKISVQDDKKDSGPASPKLQRGEQARMTSLWIPVQNDRGAKLVFAPALQGVITSFLEPVIEAATVTRLGIQQKPEVRFDNTLSRQTITQPVTETRLEEQTVEELEDEVEVVNKSEIEEIEEEGEQAIEDKLQRVVDHSVIKVRIEEINQAAKQIDTGGEISGVKIVKNLPGQHSKNRSGELNIVDPKGHLFDGSLFATIAKIASEKFSSLLDVYKRAAKIVTEDIPVTRGEGEHVSDEDVAKVYALYKGKVPPAVEVIRRVIKMKKKIKVVTINEQSPQVITADISVEKKIEGSIQDHQELAGALNAPKL